MSLRAAILVSLETQPHTGYEIAREFDTGVGYFWQATHQQIYRELGKLSDDGAVAFEHIAQSSKPAKKRYQITPEGRAELHQWLLAPAAEAPVREQLLVKVSAGYLIDSEALAAEVSRHRDIHSARLEEFKSFEAKYLKFKDQATTKQHYLYLTLRRGILAKTAWITWADEVLAYLHSTN